MIASYTAADGVKHLNVSFGEDFAAIHARHRAPFKQRSQHCKNLIVRCQGAWHLMIEKMSRCMAPNAVAPNAAPLGFPESYSHAIMRAVDVNPPVTVRATRPIPQLELTSVAPAD